MTVKIKRNDIQQAQQTGSIVEYVTVYPREIRTDADDFQRETLDIETNYPEVKAITFMLNVYGATGTFESGEGITLQAHVLNRSTLIDISSLLDQKTTDSYDFRIDIIPGLSGDNLIDATIRGGRGYAKTGVQIAGFVECNIRIDGTFEEGEGFDCEVIAKLFY